MIAIRDYEGGSGLGAHDNDGAEARTFLHLDHFRLDFLLPLVPPRVEL